MTAARIARVLLPAVASVLCAAPAAAKGLFASVPRDGVELRYEGTLKQSDFDAFGGREEFAFDRVLTVRTFGPERARRGDRDVEAWWVELEVETGTATERGVQTGPGGRVVVAALVAEDDFGVEPGGEASHQPILRGFRQIGNGPLEELPAGVLRLDPLFTLLPDLRPDEVVSSRPTTASVPAGRYDATETAGEVAFESVRMKVKTTSTVVTTDELPFGAVSWEVKFEQFGKESTKDRDAFALRTEMDEVMRLVDVGSAFSMKLDVPRR